MLNEPNSELQERSDSAAIEEMMDRTDIQMPAPIYMNQLIAGQQQIEAEEWNNHYER